VRECTVRPVVEIDDTAALIDLPRRNATRTPHQVQFRRRVEGRWQDVTCREFLAQVEDVARGLLAHGIAGGDRVAILATTRYEWTVADFACWAAGAVAVPIYETSSPSQVEWVLADSGAVACFVGSATHAATVESVRAATPALGSVWVFDDGALGALAREGRDFGLPEDALTQRRALLTADSPATLIYTSGTTGRPKGCILTHRNLMANSGNGVRYLQEVFGPGSSTLLFLPLAHVFARLIEVGCVDAVIAMGHGSGSGKELMDDLAGFQPTFLLAVPRVFEKIFTAAQATAAAGGSTRAKLYDRAVGVAIGYSEALDTGKPGPLLRAQHAVFDRLVYSHLRERLGGRAQWAISGGAPLGARLAHFFRGVGLTVLEGYGLTETTAPTTVNRPGQLRIGSVGRPLPGASIRIGDDGEVLVRGDHVFVGYWNNETASKEVLDPDGWFRTGDLGELDDDGYLSITGRKKEIIVTAGGKNVAPAVLEDRVRAHPLVSQCMVIGDRRPFIAALVTLDPETLPGWLATHGKPALTVQQASVDPDVLAAVQAAVDDANTAVSSAEAIKKVAVLADDFTEEGGQLTPTLKLKRAVVATSFAQDIEALYA